MKYENEEQIRKDFARLFGWRKERNQYDYTTEYRIPEWAEIFAQVGKLLATKDSEFVESKLEILSNRVKEVENQLNAPHQHPPRTKCTKCYERTA